MKIFVTGAAGFIGSQVAENLAAGGHDVVGVDNFNDYYNQELKRLNAASAQKVGVDIQERDLVEDGSLPADTAVVIHFAAQPGISSDVDFETYERNNIQVTENLIEAAANLERSPFFLYISTSSVYGLEATGDETTAPEPASDYGVTKLASEQLILSHQRRGEFSAASLRLFSVFGPRERPEKLFPKLLFAAQTGKDFPLYEGSREHVRSYTYVGDVVEAVSAALDARDVCDGEIINIGNDVTNTTGEAIEAVEAEMDTKINIVLQPARAGDQKKTAANIKKAKDILDWKPATSLVDGVAAHAQWFKENNVAELML